MLRGGNECGKNYVDENFKANFPNKDYDRSKTVGECCIFQILGSVVTNDVRYTCEINLKIAAFLAANFT